MTPAEDDAGALGDRVVEVLLCPRQHLGRAERAHVRLLGERVADTEGLRALDKGFHERVLHGLVDEDAFRGRAALTREVETPYDRGVRCLLDVRVGEDDLGAVPAELEHAALQRRIARDLLARVRRAGEDDRADVGMANQLGADLSAAVDDVERPGREAGVVDDLGEHVRAERRVLRRLPDRGAAEREPVDDRDPGDVDREVPGRHGGDHPYRFLDDDDALGVRALLRRRQHPARVPEDVLGRPPEVVGRVLDHLLAGLADGLPDLAGDHLGDLVRALHADRERGAAELDALQQRDLAPRLEGVGCRLHRGVDLVGGGCGDRSEQLARPRAPDLDLLAVAGNPLAADVRVLSCRNRHGLSFLGRPHQCRTRVRPIESPPRRVVASRISMLATCRTAASNARNERSDLPSTVPDRLGRLSIQRRVHG
jgi:hypothetical protein